MNNAMLRCLDYLLNYCIPRDTTIGSKVILRYMPDRTVCNFDYFLNLKTIDKISSTPDCFEVFATLHSEFHGEIIYIPFYASGNLNKIKKISDALKADILSNYGVGYYKFYEKIVDEEPRIICFKADSILYIPFIDRVEPKIIKIDLDEHTNQYQTITELEIKTSKNCRTIYLKKTIKLENSIKESNFDEMVTALFVSFDETKRRNSSKSFMDIQLDNEKMLLNIYDALCHKEKWGNS